MLELIKPVEVIGALIEEDENWDEEADWNDEDSEEDLE